MAQEILKKLIITVLLMLFVFLPSHLTHAGQFGPPEPGVNEGKLSLGVGYSHFSGILNPHKRSSLVPQHDIEQNQLYLQAGYGFIKDWEAHLRVGASDLKLDTAFPVVAARGASDTFKDSFTPFGSFEVKGLLYEGSLLWHRTFLPGQPLFRL